MSLARNNTLGSTVFQQTLLVCGAFALGCITLLWLFCGGMVWLMDREQRTTIADTVAYAEEVYYGRGDAALIAEEMLSDAGNPLWTNDDILPYPETGELIWVLRSADYEPIAGFSGLHGELGWDRGWLDHPDIWQEVRSYRVQLRGGDTLAVAMFLPEARAETLSFAQFGTVAILLITLPLALIVGYSLSQRVFSRIEAISATTVAVGAGQLASRVDQSPRHDEFDRLAGNINGMLDRVEGLTRNIEAVSVGVAHDLRTPLTNIGGRLELIRRDNGETAAVVEHLDAADAAQDQLMRVFDALLRLGEVKAGQRKAAFAPVELSALVSDMVESFAPVFEEADKTLTSDVAANLTLTGDRELLEQMVANLLENALEHGRDAAKVFVTLESLPDGPALIVGDDGPGISPVHRDLIFDRFFRADSSRNTPGNGLGLSLVQAIAELHGAEVSLVDDTKGAVFCVQFQAGN